MIQWSKLWSTPSGHPKWEMHSIHKLKNSWKTTESTQKLYTYERRDELYTATKEHSFLLSVLENLNLGPKKRWDKIFGGKWLGAESMIQFINQTKAENWYLRWKF